MKIVGPLASASAFAVLLSAMPDAHAELTANVSVSNNYLWRGLTQTMNEPAVSGGFDYAADNGFYMGTSVSNVSFAPGDVFSYEHDLYLGFSSGERVTYDVGYLYYNYDEAAQFDFGELYLKLGFGNFGLSAFVLANTEADEGPGQDFGFGQARYVSFDYTRPLEGDLTLGFHVGHHSGDFSEAFNGVPGDYVDYGVSLSMARFTLAISNTDLAKGGEDGLDNGSVKFVVRYSASFGL